MATPFHQQYLSLVDDIERRFPVAQWRSEDADMWPVARMDLYLDMYWQRVGRKPASAVPRPLRALKRAITPLSNLWNRRYDLCRHTWLPHPAYAVFLGDGVSLDHIDGAWEDRYCEPLIAALEGRSRRSLLIQRGDMRCWPWRRPNMAANTIEAAGQALAQFAGPSTQLPGHAEVVQFLKRNGIAAPSLSAVRLHERARVLRATASVFEQVLKSAKPKIAFIVTYYAGMGHAFALACRRRGILCVDLQHCPQRGRHKAYRWSNLPPTGYTTLPSAFWNWTPEEAASIGSSTGGSPWHRGLYGGHPRLAPFFDDSDPRTVCSDKEFERVGTGAKPAREILVALQPLAGAGDIWNALAEQIDAAPQDWRWWIRRHPASRKTDDACFGRLLSLRRHNVVIEEASALPLPALLRHMSVVLSLSSGACAEAAAFGVGAVFLSADARSSFADLIGSGQATIVEDLGTLNTAIGTLPPSPCRPKTACQPDLAHTLAALEEMAVEYKRLCAEHGAHTRFERQRATMSYSSVEQP